jgi:hypothetical protein
MVIQMNVPRLADISERLKDATSHLREQQSLVPDIDCPRNRATLLSLLSNGLRMFCWLENQRNGVAAQIDEDISAPRQ